jgi:hypothetical protein
VLNIITYGIAAGIVAGAYTGLGALAAWAITSIWPTLPFWPVAVLAALTMAVLYIPRSKK